MDANQNPILVEDPEEEQPVGIFCFQYQDGLLHADSGRFLAQDKNGAITLGDTKILQGYLETSNTDARCV